MPEKEKCNCEDNSSNNNEKSLKLNTVIIEHTTASGHSRVYYESYDTDTKTLVKLAERSFEKLKSKNNVVKGYE